MVVFGFNNNISEIAALSFSADAEVHLLQPSKFSIDLFIRFLLDTRPNKILGFGMYSGLDSDMLRIELTCSSKFRNQPTNPIRVGIPAWLKPLTGMKMADGIGNSYCNYVSYQICSLLPGMPYTFVHVPKNYDQSKLKSILKEAA